MYSFLAFTWMDGRYLYFRLCFFLAIGDDDLRETAYEILLAAAGPSGYFRLFCFLACNISHPITLTHSVCTEASLYHQRT
ncbi:hypothetical protein KY285_001750 [Solanum tuberosum]|nr:hypothetical protein KY285_001750 [Solanum tuberosum]